MSEKNTRLNEFTDGDSDKPDRSQRLENKVDIIKGTKPDEVLDERSDGAEKYLVVDTLTGEDEKYAIDKSAPSAKPRDSIMIMDGSKSGRVYSGDSGILGSTMASLRPDGINPTFLYYFLESNFNRINSATKGSAVPHTDKDLVRSLEYGINSFSEQRKIATVLHTVDQAIQKTEEIILQTERLRKGVMQDLFSRGTRDYDNFQETKYGTLPVSWDIKPVREVTTRIGSGGTPDTDKREYYGGKIEWVKTDDLNSGLVESAKTTITPQGLDESAAKLFPEGTVVFAMYGGALGQNGRLGMEAAMNQACCGIVTDESKMNSYLLHQQLIHRKKQLTGLSAGTHQQNISQSMIEKFEIFVPPNSEQLEMVDILKRIERTIKTYEYKEQQLKRLKSGLMQDLLSGEVRTTDVDIDILEEVAKYG